MHTVLADVYSLKSERSGGLFAACPLETSAREIALLLSLMLEARARFFFFLNHFLFQDQSSSSGVAVHIKSWVSWSYCPVTSFSLDKFRGGYHNVCCFSVNHFLYNFIYIHEYIRTSFSVRSFFLLWRYWWDILLFAGVPVAALGGAASGLRLAPLIPKLQPAGASGAVVAVIALRVTFAGWPALFQFPAPFFVVAPFRLVCRAAAAGARLLRLIHTQLTQRLA